MKRLMLTFVVLLTAILLAGSVTAQPGGQPQAPSPVVNKDNTVTFNYQSKTAQKVEVDVQFAGRHEMKKGDNDVWTITLGPTTPDIYPYCFIVDGLQVMDPQNPEWFPNEGFKNSLLDMRGDGNLPHALKNVPHGSVEYVQYWSDATGVFSNAIVYVPPSYYNGKNQKYPVMYLISGTTDTEEVYFKVGKMNLILDNLIAQGKAKEMIIVLPYGNPARIAATRGETEMMQFNLFDKDFLDNLMPFVEKNYRTINDAANRAIGGFSRGGNQALSIGLNHLDKFSHLCSYSSFTQLRPGQLDDAKSLNSKIKLFWLGVGSDDFLYGNARDFMVELDKHNIKNMKIITSDKHGHTWMNARFFLEESLPRLFQANPYKGANMKVTLPEAKQDQQFTPGVMARLFPKPVVSPEYYKDGSVTFRIKAENAKEVKLDLNQLFGGQKTMTKDADGVWSITIATDRPDIYPYNFIVDGTAICDPNNMDIFPNEGFKGSLVDIRGKEPGLQDIQKVPHGTVAYRFYHSNTLGIDRPMCVYTPEGYKPDGSEKLPVLYLIHGMTDTYETWFKVGHANTILDNLIAQGLAKRMIVVMPYANPYPEMILQGKAERYDAMDTKRIVDEITKEVVPYIEKNYNVLADADNRAIAGFSLGGRQTLATGLGNPDMFHYVAAFAPAIFGNEYETNFQNGTYAPIADLQKKLKFMFLGTGTEDFLIQASRGLDKYLTDQNLKHTFYNPGGGHTWMNCRDYLELTAKELFK
ncbi:MAG: hypothetical protein IJ911_10110 [Salinivirgaceae bacterium]|nr:hypothetical protein [Salinivirgaceae bacterium]